MSKALEKEGKRKKAKEKGGALFPFLLVTRDHFTCDAYKIQIQLPLYQFAEPVAAGTQYNNLAIQPLKVNKESR